MPGRYMRSFASKAASWSSASTRITYSSGPTRPLNGARAAAAEQETAQADFGRLQTRLDKYRARIAERNKKEGKNYLSVYYIEADGYEIQ